MRIILSIPQIIRPGTQNNRRPLRIMGSGKTKSGSCNRQDTLMCVLYVARKLGGEIVRVEERKDENN